MPRTNHWIRLIVCCWASLTASRGIAQSVSDGPHLFHRADGSVEAAWITDGKRMTQTFKKGQPVELPPFARLIGSSLVLQPHSPNSGVVDQMPPTLLAITDVEGQFNHLVRFLEANGVIDSEGRWAFGRGHLVSVGDFVDRGDQVTEVLWLMYRLSREARLAGGQVHFLIGNHEAMIMGGDTRYVAAKYRQVCQILQLPYEALVGADTELGRWLRSCNSILTVGEVVFVHGGIAPQRPVRRETIDAVNEQMRGGLGIRKQILREQDADVAELLWGRHGPLWYRGYFAADGYGPRPLGAEIDALLAALKAKTIVVGHTKVDAPCFIYEPTRVLALDVSWTKPDDVRGLRIEGKSSGFVDITGKAYPLQRAPYTPTAQPSH